MLPFLLDGDPSHITRNPYVPHFSVRSLGKFQCYSELTVIKQSNWRSMISAITASPSDSLNWPITTEPIVKQEISRNLT